MKNLIIIMLALLPISSQAGQVYKWIDERGVMQFSDKPPVQQQNTQQNAEVVTMPDFSTLSPEPQKPDEEGKQEEPPVAEKPIEFEAVSQEQIEYCKSLMANMSKLESSPRIRIKREDGEFEILDDSGRQSEMDRLKKLEKEFCD